MGIFRSFSVSPRERAEQEAKNIALKEENERLAANLDYIAMMTDVDIPVEDEPEEEEEIKDESEV